LPETRPSPSHTSDRSPRCDALTPDLRPKSTVLPLRFGSCFLPTTESPSAQLRSVRRPRSASLRVIPSMTFGKNLHETAPALGLTPLMGSVTLFATWAAGVHSATPTDRSARTFAGIAQMLATFRPQAFSASRRLAPPAAARPCFMPLPRTGFLPPGAFPPRQPHAARRHAVPSCRYRLTCQKTRAETPDSLR
jgi:hypothetical protein